MCLYMCVSVCVHACVCKYTYIYIYMCVYIYIKVFFKQMQSPEEIPGCKSGPLYHAHILQGAAVKTRWRLPLLAPMEMLPFRVEGTRAPGWDWHTQAPRLLTLSTRSLGYMQEIKWYWKNAFVLNKNAST